jgi:hypothetical protein
VVTEANQTEIFPTLTPEQVARIAPFAREKTFEDGAILWTGASGTTRVVVSRRHRHLLAAEPSIAERSPATSICSPGGQPS